MANTSAASSLAQPVSRDQRPDHPRIGRRLVIGVSSIALIAIAGGVALSGWWMTGRFIESTNDAYLRADSVAVAPRVSGYVEQVLVANNQAVGAGQPLLRIDARNYNAALAQQTATIEVQQADATALERQAAQQKALAEQAEAQLGTARSASAFAGREADRYKALSRDGVETEERYAQAANQREQAIGAERSAAAAAAAAERQVAVTEARVAQAKAQLKAAQANAQGARLNVGDTLVRAGIAGVIGDKTVQPGQFVQPGARLMSIVPVSKVYLVANFKETQVGRIRAGQRAKVKLDALPGQDIDAVVDSFAPGTGSQFALLPPENATGNFIKIVQRVPVRLRLQPKADIADHLLPGLSATVQIDTRPKGD